MRGPLAKLAGGCLLFALIVWIAAAFAFPRSLDTQYLASPFTCACGHPMVMEFSSGRVRLFNLGHQLSYEAGTYETISDRTIWHLPMYRTDLVLIPGRFSLLAIDTTSGDRLTLGRRLRPFGIGSSFRLDSIPPPKRPLEQYVKQLREVFDPRDGT